ncbi:CLUMA_CG006765, isoform A [Clunio marinus]|uniref:CLUMA_CG006765, isoform A n=1 Tax=Clunio marinus TaxID=568069 RepID=A0A1J1HYW6_9DIPT|nr:CLUMA_CG006765, isoform A [Clunio marinus]
MKLMHKAVNYCFGGKLKMLRKHIKSFSYQRQQEAWQRITKALHSLTLLTLNSQTILHYHRYAIYLRQH